MSLADVADLLACPSCAARGADDVGLALDGGTLRCPQGHAYDVARQGHVNLLGRSAPRNADTAEMVAARERFLGGGAYDGVADALTAAVLAATSDGARPGAMTVLDVGAGPGFYLDRVLAGLAGRGEAARGLALDVSVAAARRAARSPRAVGAVVADAWGRLPVRSGSVDVVLSVFAPRNAAEMVRVLAPAGSVVVVSPLPDHLVGLRAARGLLDVEPGKQERLAAAFGAHLRLLAETDVRHAADLDPRSAGDLVAMGPNAFHAGGDDGAADAAARADVAVRVSTWRRTG
jgi:23S rRNA (guanine745-N1)-methyltransferase